MAELSTPDHIWFDGAVRPWHEARVHVWTETVLRAASVFEGLRGYWNPQESRHYFVHLDRHVRRLHDSAKVTRIPHTLDEETLLKALSELVSALDYREDIYARPTLYLEKGRYTADASAMQAGFFMPVFPSPREKTIDTGITCLVSSWRRSGDDTAPPKVKAAANYYNLRLARLEADTHGYGEAILLNSAGKVAETGGASVFIVRGDTVVTPGISESILDSITRASVIELLRDSLGLRVEERQVERTELYLSDEVFLTGTLCEVTPVVGVDGTPVGQGRPGPVTTAVQRAYYEAVQSGSADTRGWLTAGPRLG
ncbi:branched-chain amino acid transaminase [Streptomyces sp. NPDC056738]|uniref:branched-chain amino acid transaminase n=1 Tax=Streptomyces sp. NPDC056738 TaxID=3345933 RepID=UPI003699D640